MIEHKVYFDKNTKVWSGEKYARVYPEDYSIGKAALDVMRKYPTKIAQICHHNGKQYTNEEIAILSTRCAHHFKKLGLQQCDIVGFCAVNSDYVAPIFYGAMLAGLTFSTLDPTYDKEGIKHAFGTTRPNIMFCDGNIYEKVQEALQECDLNIPIYTMKEHIQGVPEVTDFISNTKYDQIDLIIEPLKLGGAQTAAILCSSGTTGLPKGVCMSHESLLNGASIESEMNQRFLCFSTLHWMTGLLTLYKCTLNGQTRIITENGFTPETYLEIIEKYKVNCLLTPPSQMAMVLASPAIKTTDCSSIETYYCGGSAVHFSVVKQMKNYMPNAKFYNGYGMSEVPGLLAMGECYPEIGRVGSIAYNLEICVENDDGERLNPGETGEIHFRTIFPWLGYYNNKKATEEMGADDGWKRTGDIGYVTEDGILYIVDRKKDILKYNNFHYSPSEIEQLIYEIPEVAEVCVCGIPDVISGHLPAAAIVKKSQSQLTEENVYEYVAKNASHFKRLRGGIYFFDSLPKTVSGKIRRNEVTKLCINLKNKDEKKFQEFQKNMAKVQ